MVVSRDMLAKRGDRGIRTLVANSGCANAVTGRGGMEDAERMAREVDQLLEMTEPSTCGYEHRSYRTEVVNMRAANRLSGMGY